MNGISCMSKFFECPICIDLLKDPVTIACGHNFCKDCLSDKIKACPICRMNIHNDYIAINYQLRDIILELTKSYENQNIMLNKSTNHSDSTSKLQRQEAKTMLQSDISRMINEGDLMMNRKKKRRLSDLDRQYNEHLSQNQVMPLSTFNQPIQPKAYSNYDELLYTLDNLERSFKL